MDSTRRYGFVPGLGARFLCSVNHFRTTVCWLGLALLVGCAVAPTPPPAPPSHPPKEEVAPAPKPLPKIALVLGGGAVRGFAHVGVIKVLEAQGINPDMVVGTSAGSVVGVLYAAGYSGFDLQKVALKLDEDTVGDWALPSKGFIKGEALQDFINKAVRNQPLEKLRKPFAAVATDLHSGEPVVFRRGNAGQAVRASSSVPGVFQPVSINGRDYVDGGLVSPIPVKAARDMGAEVVIAVDISAKPRYARIEGIIDILLQTFAIMGQTLGRNELAGADVVIRPETGGFGAADFTRKHEAIMEGEKAALAALPLIRKKIQQAMEGSRIEPATQRN
ncbi:MAG: patatin-like phospholipase family protein [Methylophilaceae bacterium]|nr:patatin-like phospholipase family protein [Methylophilaceae bacterium]